MIQHADIAPERNSLQILISAHDKEVSISKEKNGNENNNEQDENIETDISAAMAEASHEMKRISTEEYNEENLTNLFYEGCSQLIMVDQVSEDISVLYNDDSSKLQQFIILILNYYLLLFLLIKLINNY